MTTSVREEQRKEVAIIWNSAAQAWCNHQRARTHAAGSYKASPSKLKDTLEFSLIYSINLINGGCSLSSTLQNAVPPTLMQKLLLTITPPHCHTVWQLYGVHIRSYTRYTAHMEVCLHDCMQGGNQSSIKKNHCSFQELQKTPPNVLFNQKSINLRCWIYADKNQVKATNAHISRIRNQKIFCL